MSIRPCDRGVSESSQAGTLCQIVGCRIVPYESVSLALARALPCILRWSVGHLGPTDITPALRTIRTCGHTQSVGQGCSSEHECMRESTFEQAPCCPQAMVCRWEDGGSVRHGFLEPSHPRRGAPGGYSFLPACLPPPQAHVEAGRKRATAVNYAAATAPATCQAAGPQGGLADASVVKYLGERILGVPESIWKWCCHAASVSVFKTRRQDSLKAGSAAGMLNGTSTRLLQATASPLPVARALSHINPLQGAAIGRRARRTARCCLRGRARCTGRCESRMRGPGADPGCWRCSWRCGQQCAGTPAAQDELAALDDDMAEELAPLKQALERAVARLNDAIALTEQFEDEVRGVAGPPHVRCTARGREVHACARAGSGRTGSAGLGLPSPIL